MMATGEGAKMRYLLPRGRHTKQHIEKVEGTPSRVSCLPTYLPPLEPLRKWVLATG